MKVLNALFLALVVLAALFAALMFSETLCWLFSVRGGTRYPLVASAVHVVLVAVLFGMWLSFYLRARSMAAVSLAGSGIVGVLLLTLHFLK